MILRHLKQKWLNYRYRFVPWIMLNLRERKVRKVEKGQNDKVITDEEVLKSLTNYFTVLNDTANTGIQTDSKDIYLTNVNKMRSRFRFITERKQSILPTGGLGVFVTEGHVDTGTVVCMYPGTIYQPYEPILLQSFGNPFIFRCIDGVLIDGNDKNLSKYICRSCCERDRIGPYFTNDMSWLTHFPVNPLAIGQYVNNQSTEHPANVAYQELDVPADFSFHLRKFLPNGFYSSSYGDDTPKYRLTRVVVLVSLRQINKGEELFSSYFTVVH